MMINLEFKVFHISKKPANAERSIRRMMNHNKCNFQILHVEPYLQKGSVAKCLKPIEAGSWEQLVYQSIVFFQSFSPSLFFSGFVDEELCITTDRLNAGDGVTLVSLDIRKNDILDEFGS